MSATSDCVHCQKTIDKNVTYPPELVVLVTPDISEETRNTLFPVLCTRIIEVPVLGLPPGINRKMYHDGCSPWDDHCPGLTKLHAFRLEVYDTIVFIEADCLVLDDVYPLIKKGKVYTEQESLVAAAPDMFPPDKFNSGVMVIRPSQATFDNMMGQKKLLANYDGGDTGFLNAYYSEWHTEMAPLARLPFTWNAQRALYDMTYEKGHRNYWDVAISPDLHIIHYSGSPKPWEVPVDSRSRDDEPKATIRKVDYLNDLWRQWSNRSKNFVARYQKEKAQKKNLEETALIRQKQKEIMEKHQSKRNPRDVHKIVSKRYKELRQQGHDAKTAMAMSRAEHGLEDEQPVSVGAQVASMFGVML